LNGFAGELAQLITAPHFYPIPHTAEGELGKQVEDIV
jgi:hypothetical protein